MSSPGNSDPSERLRQGVVAVCRRDDRFLIIRRSQHVVAPGAFCFPGGAIEAGEQEEAALLREMREELNCRAAAVRRLWRSETDWGVALAWWLTEIEQPDQLRPNAAEVESVHWMLEDEMRAAAELLSSNLAFLDAWRSGQFELE